jgi:iron complex outermembrane receptor protein
VEGDILDSRIHDGYDKYVGPNPGGMVLTDLNSRPAAGFLMGKWVRKLSDTSEFQLQSYVSRAQILDTSVGAKRDDIDVQFQHSFLKWNQRFLWGLEARAGRSRFDPRPNISFNPSTGDDHLGAMFLQDEIELRPTLHLTLGAKYEHNNYTGAETQPSAQVAWTPAPTRTWWASVGRAVRAPSQVDTSLSLNFTDATVPEGLSVHINGNPNSVSETLLAYETGYRIQLLKRVSFDVAAFYNIYKHLRSAEQLGIGFDPNPWPHGVIMMQFDGKARGTSKGIEVTSNWKVTSSWRLTGSYSWLNLSIQADPDSLDPAPDMIAGESPKNQAQVRSYWEVTRKIQFDAGYSYSGSLPAQNLPAYGRLNGRLGMQLTRTLEIAISVDNALNHKHYEFRSARDRSGYHSKRFGRSEQLSMTWRF